MTTGSTFAATANYVWRATLTSTTTTTVHGGATLVEVGNGRLASVAVKLYGVTPKATTGSAAAVAVTLTGTFAQVR